MGFRKHSHVKILAAFHGSAVKRLKSTWALVPAETIQTLLEIDAVMSSDLNYKVQCLAAHQQRYRAYLRDCSRPCVPYLGIMLTDLTFLDEGNKNFVEGMKTYWILTYRFSELPKASAGCNNSG